MELAPRVGVDFHLTGWSQKAQQAFADQWCGDRHPTSAHWDWHDIYRRHSTEPDRLEMVVWSPDDRLCCLGLALSAGRAIEVRFVEGDPREGCPLKGRRSLIVFECAAAYAQGRGKAELRAQPVNARLQSLYRDVYGFNLEKPARGTPYWVRKV
mgnify:CR=1 FL=1